jgi:Tfp pilus assembly protein FimT
VREQHPLPYNPFTINTMVSPYLVLELHPWVSIRGSKQRGHSKAIQDLLNNWNSRRFHQKMTFTQKAKDASVYARSQNRQTGFTLIDTIVALAIIMIVAGFATPTILRGVNNMRLRAAASDFSSLIQRARVAAVQKNDTYAVLFNLPSGRGAYVDVGKNSTFDSTKDPMIQFGGSVYQAAAPAGASGKPTNLDDPSGPLGWTATAGNISFNARGFPCSGTPCTTNVNFVFYFTDYSSNNSQWAAVSITAAGHPKTWWWNGSAWVN